MDELIYSIWLSAKTGIKPINKLRLYEKYQSFKAIYECTEIEYKSIPGIRPSEISALVNKDLDKARKISDYCLKNGLLVLGFDSPAYPQRLKNIYDPPLVLFVKGSLPDIDSLPVISVIGTRNADEYGLKISSDIAYEISLCGGIVVSGLTTGADASAAEGALASGMPVIGVLGTSHDKCSSALAKKVASAGALISEYPPGTEANKSFFRARNRIAAGLSLGVVVTQAPEKSGTKLFASEAAEQGKDVFVVPGNVDSENSTGIYQLMRDGAMPVISGKDVVREYLSAYPDLINPFAADNAEKPDVIKNAKASVASRSLQNAGKNKVPGRIVRAQAAAAEDKLIGLTDKQRSAVGCLSDSPKFVEEIMYITEIPVNELLSMLTLLEIKGIVKRGEDGKYLLN